MLLDISFMIFLPYFPAYRYVSNTVSNVVSNTVLKINISYVSLFTMHCYPMNQLLSEQILVNYGGIEQNNLMHIIQEHITEIDNISNLHAIFYLC